jgi:hypothetical protein
MMVLMRMNKKLDEDEGAHRVGAVPSVAEGSDPETMNKGYRYLV